jgi:hypothetical protein
VIRNIQNHNPFFFQQGRELLGELFLVDFLHNKNHIGPVYQISGYPCLGIFDVYDDIGIGKKRSTTAIGSDFKEYSK